MNIKYRYLAAALVDHEAAVPVFGCDQRFANAQENAGKPFWVSRTLSTSIPLAIGHRLPWYGHQGSPAVRRIVALPDVPIVGHTPMPELAKSYDGVALVSPLRYHEEVLHSRIEVSATPEEARMLQGCGFEPVLAKSATYGPEHWKLLSMSLGPWVDSGTCYIGLPAAAAAALA